MTKIKGQRTQNGDIQEFIDIDAIHYELQTETGSIITLQNCVGGKPKAFLVFGNTVTNDNKTTEAARESFSVTVNSNTIALSLPLYALVKNGDTYADIADLIARTVTEKVKKLVFTGEEEFTTENGVNVFTIPFEADYHNATGNYDTKTGAICTHFTLAGYGAITASGGYKNGFFGMAADGAKIKLSYCPDGDTQATAAQLKAYLAAQYENNTPVTLFYILAAENTKDITVPSIGFVDGVNTVSTSADYELSVTCNKQQISPAPDAASMKPYFVAKQSTVDSANSWWDDFKNFTGRNPAVSPVDEQMQPPLVSGGMITAHADRWKTGQQGMSTKGVLSDSVFVQGGHVFEGWDTAREWRLTALIGKFIKGRAHIFSFKPNQSGVEEFGTVTVGSDHEFEGLDCNRKWTHMWGNIIATSFSGSNNTGSQKYYGGISGTDKTTPSGANLEITAERNSTRPSRAQFNGCSGGLLVPVLAEQPGVLEDGLLWFDSTDRKLKIVVNGAVKSLAVES